VGSWARPSRRRAHRHAAGALYPLDRAKNANGRRRVLGPVAGVPAEEPPPTTKDIGMAPLLRQLIDAYDRTGLPPAYLPKRDDTDDETENA
jgi:hypothetical protein